MSKFARTGAIALGGLAAAAALGGVLFAAEPGVRTQAAAVAAPAFAAPMPRSFSDVVERVSPAVVSVRVSGAEVRGGAPKTPEFRMPEPFRRFFGDEFFRRFEFDGPRREFGPGRRGPAMGSGFVIDADGHVVTNEHVVASGNRIEISMTDGRTFEAKVVGRDPKTDLALLKIDGGGSLPHVAFGRSDDVKVGDWVLAIGSPFGLGNTVTTGIVSARGRDIGSGPYDDFLQIDAPINRGNSGGPSFNLRGEVIGVNTAIVSPTGVSAGIGFAVPSDLASEVIAQLRTAGKVARGWLGVHVQEVTRDLADGLGLEAAEGALVAQVETDGPAAEAGLRQGDVIVAVDGERIESMRELPRLIARLPAGAEARLSVIRAGSEIERSVRIGALPGGGETVAAAAGERSDLGMTLAALDDESRARFGVAPEVDGVVVTAVAPEGVAGRRGLRPGDVILKVQGRDVRTPADVDAEIRRAADERRKSLLALIRRAESDLYVALPTGGA